MMTTLLDDLGKARMRANLADRIWADFQRLKNELPPDSDIQSSIDGAYTHLQRISLKTRRDLAYAIAKYKASQTTTDNGSPLRDNPPASPHTDE